jgi:hypothetical protein
MKLVEVPVDLAQRDIKIGDLLKFQVFPDNKIVYGVYLSHHYDFRNHGEDQCQDEDDMYAVFHVIPFGTDRTNNFYDWEYIENLTASEREYAVKKEQNEKCQ